MEAIEGWQAEYRHELEHGKEAREAGNEGKARVCARRAAGILAGEYLERKGELTEGWSAYQRLQALDHSPNLPARAAEIISHLTTRVDLEHRLPIEADLLAEVEELQSALLGE
jgi:hypothetical protein